MAAERGDGFAAHAGRLLDALSRAAHDWRERSQATYSSASTEETLLDTDTFLSAIEDVLQRWRELDPPEDQAEAAERVAAALDDLRARLDELVSAIDAGEPERVRIALQAALLSLDEVDGLRRAVG